MIRQPTRFGYCCCDGRAAGLGHTEELLALSLRRARRPPSMPWGTAEHCVKGQDKKHTRNKALKTRLTPTTPGKPCSRLQGRHGVPHPLPSAGPPPSCRGPCGHPAPVGDLSPAVLNQKTSFYRTIKLGLSMGEREALSGLVSGELIKTPKSSKIRT